MNLQDTFAVLKPDLLFDLIKVSPTIYQELDENYNNFKGHTLVSTYEFDSDWGMWERHPAGDELVILLSGAAKMLLKQPTGEEVVALTEPGDYLIVPKNIWHTARVSEPTRMLFITPGEGTEHREDA